jgi:peptidyl-prolyl cis-trans isomerase C
MKTCILMAVLSAATYGQLLPAGLAPTPSSSTAAPAPRATMTEDTVVATLGGISVTLGDVRKILETAPQALSQMFQKDPRQALQQVYIMRYLAAEGAKSQLDQKEPLKGEIDALIELLKQQVLANAMVNEEWNRYEITGDMIDQFYQKNQARWAEAKIKIILLGFKPPPLPGAVAAEPSPTPGGAAPTSTEALEAKARNAVEAANAVSQRTEEQAHTLASGLVKQLRAGADFAKLVAQYSDDAESKASGGDFGTPIKATSSFATDLKKVVFDLKPGEISEPVRQGNGYYIIRLEEKTIQPINDVRNSIVKEIRDTHRDEYMKELGTRFTPQVQRPEFFVSPGMYLSQPPVAATAAPAKP